MYSNYIEWSQFEMSLGANLQASGVTNTDGVAWISFTSIGGGRSQIFLAVISWKCCLTMSGVLFCESVLTKEETCHFEEEGAGWLVCNLKVCLVVYHKLYCCTAKYEESKRYTWWGWAQRDINDLKPLSIVQLLLFLTLIIIIMGAYWCYETLLFSAKALFVTAPVHFFFFYYVNVTTHAASLYTHAQNWWHSNFLY